MPAYSFKKQFVNPIRVGLGLDPFLDLHEQFVGDTDAPITPKRQTIRAIGRRRHARPGETLQLYHGMRTKQCFKIAEARCISVDPIVINVYDTRLEILRFAPDPERLEEFARADGFKNAADMHAFWAEEHGLGYFSGVLIRWEPI
jgi:hypothetical protein